MGEDLSTRKEKKRGEGKQMYAWLISAELMTIKTEVCVFLFAGDCTRVH